MIELVREVPIADHVKRYAVRLVRATHPGSRCGAERSTSSSSSAPVRAGIQAMILGAKVRALSEGRFHVACDDIKAVCSKPALRHRLILNFEGEAEDISRTDDGPRRDRGSCPEIRESQRPPECGPHDRLTSERQLAVAMFDLEFLRKLEYLDVVAKKILAGKHPCRPHCRASRHERRSSRIYRSLRGRRRPALRRLEHLRAPGGVLPQALQGGGEPSADGS